MPRTFDSLASFVAYAQTLTSHWACYEPSSRDWDSNVGWQGAIERSLRGDDTLCAKAQAILDKLADANIETSASVWEYDVAGMVPDVPVFLSGNPACMRTKTLVSNESQPIGIWVDTFVSCGIPADKYLLRGMAIVALLLKLQAIRPVDLHIIMDRSLPGVGASVTINSRPLDLSTCAFALAHAAFARRMGFAGGSIGEMDYPISDPRIYHQRYPIAENDIVIPGANYGDPEVYTDPIAWVNRQVARVVATQD